MKGKSLVSILAVVSILAAIAILLKNAIGYAIEDIDEMEGEVMILLGILGLSLAIIALATKSEKGIDDEEISSEAQQLKHTETKLQELRNNGILSEAEYQQKLGDAKLKSGGYKKTVESLKALLDAGLLTEEEFERKSKEAYEKSMTKPSTQSKEEPNDPADKVAKLMELREADLISQEEFEEQMAKI